MLYCTAHTVQYSALYVLCSVLLCQLRVWICQPSCPFSSVEIVQPDVQWRSAARWLEIISGCQAIVAHAKLSALARASYQTVKNFKCNVVQSSFDILVIRPFITCLPTRRSLLKCVTAECALL